MTLNSIQSTYTTAIASGMPGMIADSGLRNIRSRTVEDAAGVAFGKAVFRGAGDHGVTATPATGTFMGIVVAKHDTQAILTATTADVIRQYQSAGIMDMGRIWVAASLAVADGDPVYVTPAGLFTNVSNSGANFLLPAVYDDTIAAAGNVRIRVRMDDTA